MSKSLKELTNEEGQQILEFVYPSKNYWFQKIVFEEKIEADGSRQITLSGQPLVGIFYHNGDDNCLLPFENSKVILWLYKNGYDVSNFLEKNQYFSEMEDDFEHVAFSLEVMCKSKKPFTQELFVEKVKKLLEKYYYKEYD